MKKRKDDNFVGSKRLMPARRISSMDSTSSMDSRSGSHSITKTFAASASLLMFVLMIGFLGPASASTITEPARNNSYAFFEETNTDLYFSHLTVNTFTGQVYVGGVNRIYQLSTQLALDAVAIMGPKEDSADCPGTRNCPNVVKKSTDYYNKVLVVDYAQSRLISCGSLFQGVCSVHKLDNVTNYNTPANESVVANNSTASTVAFIAPGPQKSPKHVLYVGVSYTANGPYRSDVPAVSSRSLDPNGILMHKSLFNSGKDCIIVLLFICSHVHHCSHWSYDWNSSTYEFIGTRSISNYVRVWLSVQRFFIFCYNTKEKYRSSETLYL